MSAERSFMIWAIAGTGALHVSVPIVVLRLRDDEHERALLTNMTVIEAALAYKKTSDKKQPQKDRRPKPKAEQPVGVSRDDTKAPVERPDAGPPQEEDLAAKAAAFMEQHKDEDEGEETPKPGGDFNGSERGWVEVGKGEPYFQDLAADFYNAWDVPSLEKGAGAAIGSVRLDEQGRVIDTKFEASGNANIDRSVQLALRAIQKAREKGDKPVPLNLLKEATEQWLSFSFDVTKAP